MSTRSIHVLTQEQDLLQRINNLETLFQNYVKPIIQDNINYHQENHNLRRRLAVFEQIHSTLQQQQHEISTGQHISSAGSSIMGGPAMVAR
jgi:regulator of replication initiation timing